MTTQHNKATQAAIESINWNPERSAWARGVKAYAVELIESLDGDYSPAALLNGATDWRAYSYGGCSLIHDAKIAKRLCSPSELKRCKGGDNQPNSRESWLDVQTRALRQAARLVHEAYTA